MAKPLSAPLTLTLATGTAMLAERTRAPPPLRVTMPQLHTSANGRSSSILQTAETDSPITLDSSIPYSPRASPSSTSSEEGLEMAREMEQLHELATSVRGNLRLRPVRSFVRLREAEEEADGGATPPRAQQQQQQEEQSAETGTRPAPLPVPRVSKMEERESAYPPPPAERTGSGSPLATAASATQVTSAPSPSPPRPGTSAASIPPPSTSSSTSRLLSSTSSPLRQPPPPPPLPKISPARPGRAAPHQQLANSPFAVALAAASSSAPSLSSSSSAPAPPTLLAVPLAALAPPPLLAPPLSTAPSAYRPPALDPDPRPSSSSLSSSSLAVPPVLLSLLSSPRQPLILDTRPLPSFLSARLRESINLAIPSLILKRYAKQGGGWSLDALRGYVTTEGGREAWDGLLAGSSGSGPAWDGTVVIYDEEMDESTRGSVRALSQAWTLGTVLLSLVGPQSVHYLLGGFSALRSFPPAAQHLIAGDAYLEPQQQQQYQYQGSPMLSGQELTVRSAGLNGQAHTGLTAPGTGRSSIGTGNGAGSSAGLFSLRTDVASARRRFALEVDPEPQDGQGGTSGTSSSASSSQPSSQRSRGPPPLLSPSPVPAIGALRPLGLPSIVDASPSPPPSAACFPRTPRRQGTTPSELPFGLSLTLAGQPCRSPLPPKLQLRTAPIRSNTAPVPPSPGLLRITPPSPNHAPRSPSHALLSPLPLSPISISMSRGPASPRPPPSPIVLRPHTAPFDYPPRAPSPSANPRQNGHGQVPATPTSSSAPQPFVISEILPGFLYLGPEPSTDDEVQQLLDLGVKRILNMAEECEDDQGLGLRRKFEMYERVPMRDTVDEENIGRGVRAACLFLDDARLHDSPTYVHCKAGKSRSVTVVMGYLIHAHSWPLSKAYAYVMEKRHGISPNIGFVSELMKFEESQLGTKSVGVGEDGREPQRNAKPAGLGLRRVGRGGGARESLPPLSRGASVEDVLVLSGGPREAHLPQEGGREQTHASSRLGDAATEKEVKDSEGRYVHAKKVPVDRRTLQPQRRVSKAGLESAWIASTARPTA
ncbi:hypothetical protein CALVIDRAFT_541509 [Calocera viscosa TUFC12733]|uniref:protein-tyrosine-phosphatase n=1 Tax=Calocera viscosa (strain TUFC12733) TaxID=1330018 RepID=A0A167HLJ8_CALVF|nr:hypothetical protein CALVIDRAFT_541509 [Calocera viscosa TUFC12733]